MSDIDDYASALLEQSKRMLEKARECEPDGVQAYLHASLLLAITSLEAHVNAIAQEFSDRADMSVHDRSVLLEREARLKNGVFEISGTLKMHRLEDRIEFLYVRLSGSEIDKKSAAWWSGIQHALSLRNSITHPKAAVVLTVELVANAVAATSRRRRA